MKTEPQPTETTSDARRRGNVARLPKILRDLVNSMLDDGNPYSEIVKALENSIDPQLPHPVSERNISNWFDGGYQDYLRHQSWRERIDTRADRYLDVAATDAPRLVAGSLYAATLEISELMDELAQSKADDTDATKLARISHALARLSQSTLNIQQYRDKRAKQKEAKESAEKPKRGGVTREELKAITERMRL
jgi:hypothetical protein